jgi:hypothetical protein
MFLAGIGQAQAPADSAGAGIGLTADIATDHWAVDSTPYRKNRRQHFWAYVVAKDSIVGKYRATRPVLKLHCDNDRKRLGIQIWTGQFTPGGVISLMNHTGRTRVIIQHDDQPAREAVWWAQTKDYVIAPFLDDGAKAVEELLASRRYRIGVFVDSVGRQDTEFDVTGAAEQAARLTSQCRAKK